MSKIHTAPHRNNAHLTNPSFDSDTLPSYHSNYSPNRSPERSINLSFANNTETSILGRDNLESPNKGSSIQQATQLKKIPLFHAMDLTALIKVYSKYTQMFRDYHKTHWTKLNLSQEKISKNFTKKDINSYIKDINDIQEKFINDSTASNTAENKIYDKKAGYKDLLSVIKGIVDTREYKVLKQCSSEKFIKNSLALEGQRAKELQEFSKEFRLSLKEISDSIIVQEPALKSFGKDFAKDLLEDNIGISSIKDSIKNILYSPVTKVIGALSIAAAASVVTNQLTQNSADKEIEELNSKIAALKANSSISGNPTSGSASGYDDSALRAKIQALETEVSNLKTEATTVAQKSKTVATSLSDITIAFAKAMRSALLIGDAHPCIGDSLLKERKLDQSNLVYNTTLLTTSTSTDAATWLTMANDQTQKLLPIISKCGSRLLIEVISNQEDSSEAVQLLGSDTQ